MPLRHEPDVSQARWFTGSRDDWVQLCSFGPSGFPAYARLFHPLPAGADESDRDELANLEGDLEEVALRVLVEVLARHTATPEDCFFGLWDGFGNIHGSPSVALLQRGRGRGPRVPPAFSPVMNGPRVSVPHRDYLLFRGPLDQAGQWGAADMLPGHPRTLNSPNLMWPRDRAWFCATEIDLPWTGIGGSAELIEDLLAEDSLDVARAQPSSAAAYWRT